MEEVSSICRTCGHFCAVLVQVEDRKIVGVRGDEDDPCYAGYTCIKGREHWKAYNHPDRLLKPLKRMPDGTVVTISSEDAIDEVADRLRDIIDRHGPQSVAMFWGNHFATESSVNLSMYEAFMKGIGSPMAFSSMTIDSPGKIVAKGFFGMWGAPGYGSHDPEVALLIGSNPLVSHFNPIGHPRSFLKALSDRGGKLIVIDPRRSDTAKRAAIHLQAKPGTDALILGAMCRIVLAEGREDAEFVGANVQGLDALRETVAEMTPELVAEIAGIDAEDLVSAARLLSGTRRAYGLVGTGPNMGGNGTLVEYLNLCLDTICGHWMRGGERVRNAFTLVPKEFQLTHAQATPPFPAYDLGHKMRVRGLTETLAGLPTGALAEEILMPGEGQIRALISVGGNPANSIPDQLKMVEALESLELLIHTDVQMTATAQLADYVIPCRLPYEIPSTSIIKDFDAHYANGFGYLESYAAYAPAVVEPPEGSDVLKSWQVLYRIAQRLGVTLSLADGLGELVSGGTFTDIDMVNEPTDDDLLDIVNSGGRVSYDSVKSVVGGHLYPEPAVYVAEKSPDWDGRLDVGNPEMMADLEACLRKARRPASEDDLKYPFRLLSRRVMHVTNSPTFYKPTNRKSYNPAFMHPDDLTDLGIESGELVVLDSKRSSIVAIAEADRSMRLGTISMSHNFGALPGKDDEDDVRRVGSNTGRLIANDQHYERYTGQPRMSDIPVAVRALATADAVAASER